MLLRKEWVRIRAAKEPEAEGDPSGSSGGPALHQGPGGGAGLIPRSAQVAVWMTH